MAELLDLVWATPPVTRTFAAAIFVESVLSLLGIVDPYCLAFPSWDYMWKGQIWRLFTSFCLTWKMGILYDTYFVWKYAGPLEKGSPRFDSASFFVYMFFVGSLILGTTNQLFGLMIFLDPMIIAIIYTYAQENRGSSAHFWIVSVEVRYLPYLLLLMKLVQGGPSTMLYDAVGIPVAHLYDFLTVYWPRYGGGPNLLKTPSFVRQWFGEAAEPAGAPKVEDQGFGTAIRAREPTQATSSGSSWASRGQGRRLGGD